MNSKIFAILIVLLAIGIVISAASAVDLVKDVKNDDFVIKTVSGTNFTKTVNIATNDVDFEVFENFGNNSKDFNSIIFFKDSTADKNEINSFIKDLENSGTKVEESNKYVVLKNTHNSSDFDIASDFDGIFNIGDSIFSSDGLNVSADGNSISLSNSGLKVSGADGEKVSITTEGISVSGNASSDNVTVDVSSDVDSSIKNCDYSIYLKNKDTNNIIVLSGNNLELLKSMAEVTSFNEN